MHHNCHIMSTDYSKVNIILEIYKPNEGHRDSRLWFLDKFDAAIYVDYKGKYPSTQLKSPIYCYLWIFELSGVLVNH